MRIYVPSTLPALRVLLDDRATHVTTAYAVTPGMVEWYAGSDPEEMEYAALTAAARASLRLLDADGTAPRRRVVLAVDVADGEARADDDADRGAVRVGRSVPLTDVAAVHVDDPGAEGDVAAAADAVLEADLGGEDAAFVVDGAEGHELLWFATQEAVDLVKDLTPLRDADDG